MSDTHTRRIWTRRDKRVAGSLDGGPEIVVGIDVPTEYDLWEALALTPQLFGVDSWKDVDRETVIGYVYMFS